MQYTLKTARKALAESSNAYGANDLRAMINRAIQNLSNMAGWQQLRKVLRFSAIGPHFVLPQGCAGLVRACVNGRPATIRAQDFRFIHSGPGDMIRPPSGFRPLGAANVLDIGMKPVMFEPSAPFYVFASTPSGTSGTAVTVKGLTPEGELRAIPLKAQQAPEYDPLTDELIAGTPIADMELPGVVFQQILEVTVEEGGSEYVTLYAADAVLSDHRFPIALYNPEVEAPEFRHYSISDIAPGQPIELLVETRIDPMPLVLETDVLPFPTLNPVEWMIRGDWYMKAGEVDQAQKYYSQAASWLKAQEVVKETMQTSLVVNSVFENSMGQLSAESVNI